MKFKQLVKPFTLAIFTVIPLYAVFLVLFLNGFINSFILLGALLMTMIVTAILLILFRRRQFIMKMMVSAFLLATLLVGYEARLLNYESLTYLVESERAPEEIIPQTNLFMLSVGTHDIHYIEDKKVLLETLEANNIQPLQIEQLTNLDKYVFKTTDLADFILFRKNLFNTMGDHVHAYLGEELAFITEFLERKNLHGNSAGLALALSGMMKLDQLSNSIPISLTGALEKNGDVTAVGSIRSKMIIAAENDFQHIIVPQENLAEAVQIKQEESLPIHIIPTEHIQDAIESIQNLNESTTNHNEPNR